MDKMLRLIRPHCNVRPYKSETDRDVAVRQVKLRLGESLPNPNAQFQYRGTMLPFGRKLPGRERCCKFIPPSTRELALNLNPNDLTPDHMIALHRSVCISKNSDIPLVIYKEGGDGSMSVVRRSPGAGPEAMLLLKNIHYQAMVRDSNGELLVDNFDTHSDSDRACGVRALARAHGISD